MKRTVHCGKNKSQWREQLCRCTNACGWSETVQAVCVRVSYPPVWALIHRPPVADKHFTELHQRENRRTEKQRGRTKWGTHQRPIPPTVFTCCNIPVVTADKPLYKQPAQILPAGYTHSKAAFSLFIEVLPGQQARIRRERGGWSQTSVWMQELGRLKQVHNWYYCNDNLWNEKTM